MKKILLIIALFGALFGIPAFASDAKTGKGSNFEFEDLLIQGKFQFSNETVSTVEEDKVLDALLSVRKDFRDRIKASSAKY